jgi:hypothetical protein
MGQVCYELARSLDDVVDSWRIVYDAYLAQGLIEPNPFGLFTACEALSPDTVWVIGRINGVAVSTATAIVDRTSGLPLDCAFNAELGALRREGRRILEIGVWATTVRTSVSRTMQLCFHYGYWTGCTDFVCGMHPRRASLYHKLFGMEVVGEPRNYPALEQAPVQLMRGVYKVVLISSGLYRLEKIMQSITPASFFAARYIFNPVEANADPRIADFMEYVLRK